MNPKALVTTAKDLSSEWFEKHGWDIILYGSDSKKEYETVYFRDPFNDDTVSEESVRTSLANIHGSRSIDGIESFEDMLSCEDKYNQYQLYRDWMPATFLPSETQFVQGRHLAKKRISQRAKDILFDITDVEIDDNWIFQEIMDIVEELRVYAVLGNVIPQASIKSSKINGKVKVIGKKDLSEKELEFCKEISDKSGLDFIGIDVAVLSDGSLKLIEVNRSPQFKKFVELYGEAPLLGILDI